MGQIEDLHGVDAMSSGICDGVPAVAQTPVELCDWDLPFVADHINHTMFDDFIADYETGTLGNLHLHNSEHVLRSAMTYLHNEWRSSPQFAAPKDKAEKVQLWDPCGRKTSPQPPPNPKGRLQAIAAMVLMTFMYPARGKRLSVSWPRGLPVGT